MFNLEKVPFSADGAYLAVGKDRRGAGSDAGELNMVFQFELMDADASEALGKWGSPALSVPDTNAERQMDAGDSVFNHYRKLIALRKDGRYREIIVYGSCRPLLAEDERLFVFERLFEERRLLVLCSFTPEAVPPPAELGRRLSAAPLISNYTESALRPECLQPYGGPAYLLGRLP